MLQTWCGEVANYNKKQCLIRQMTTRMASLSELLLHVFFNGKSHELSWVLRVLCLYKKKQKVTTKSWWSLFIPKDVGCMHFVLKQWKAQCFCQNIVSFDVYYAQFINISNSVFIFPFNVSVFILHIAVIAGTRVLRGSEVKPVIKKVSNGLSYILIQVRVETAKYIH